MSFGCPFHYLTEVNNEDLIRNVILNKIVQFLIKYEIVYTLLARTLFDYNYGQTIQDVFT